MNVSKFKLEKLKLTLKFNTTILLQEVSVFILYIYIIYYILYIFQGGEPPPTVRWLREGRLIDASFHRYLGMEQADFAGSVLTLTNATQLIGKIHRFSKIAVNC